MTDNRTTELLREGLTERGVEWKNVGGTTSGDGITEWIVDGMTCRAAQRATVGIEHLALYIPVLTPEQAIAATLGSGTCEIALARLVDVAAKVDIDSCAEILECVEAIRKAVKR